jgi:chloramphenicol 3-O phosphotransferase
MTGRIIILNGAPRSGKSSLAKAIQASIAGTWLNLGVDSLAASTPPALMPGIGLRPGGEKPDLEPKVAELYDFLFASIGLAAQHGFDIVADLGMHEDYATPLHILGGDTPPPPVLRWQEYVHRNKDYDLRLDMGRLTSDAGAAAIAGLLANPPAPPVLAKRAVALS